MKPIYRYRFVMVFCLELSHYTVSYYKNVVLKKNRNKSIIS